MKFLFEKNFVKLGTAADTASMPALAMSYGRSPTMINTPISSNLLSRRVTR